ncbi:S-layer homology domain-containing protein, partial [Mycobacterium tuberculosis]|uniref:S-layer homology domain-containing protein n=1 Tax=Mycobacterium tuberculosis TaxID=1773 RepID=UPI0011151CAC
VMTSQQFRDQENITPWAQEGVNIAASNGVIKGYPDGEFKPRKNITRAEAAVMFHRLLQIME